MQNPVPEVLAEGGKFERQSLFVQAVRSTESP